jgi:diacylglycerol kinase (ATP)
MKATIIANPEAGQHAPADDIAQVTKLLRESDIEVSSVDTTLGPGDATTFARRAVANDTDLVFLLGGDGSIAQVVDGLVDSNTALGVLPGGSGNVFARQLNLPIPGSMHPKPIVESARLLLSGQIRRVDVGCMTLGGGRGPVRHFLCWGGVGFEAEVQRNVAADKDIKRRLGSPLAHFVTTFMTLAYWRGTSARLRIDGHPIARRIVMLTASNIQLYGLSWRLAENAKIDDGLLDVYGFLGSSAFRTFRHGIKVPFARHIDDPEVEIYRARRIEIRTSRRLAVSVDGDYVGETPVVIEILPKALNILAPPGAPASLFVDPEGLAPPPQSLWDSMKGMARDVQTAIKERSSQT